MKKSETIDFPRKKNWKQIVHHLWKFTRETEDIYFISRGGLLFPALFLFFSSCQSPAGITQAGEIINDYITDGMNESKEIPVYVATNRKGSYRFGCDNSSFSTEPFDEIRFGRCDFYVPAKHTVGSLDAGKPGAKTGDLFSLLKSTELNESMFMSEAEDEKRGLILFVHGFNVLYQEALLRAAQIKYDLKFPGKVVVYTWPAGSKGGLFDQFMLNNTYANNFQNAQDSRIQFAEFLRKIAKLDGPKYLIVHSMGHQVVIPVLEELYKEGSDKIFREVVFNAPDYPETEFTAISGDIAKLSNRTTLYCSPNDNALNVSSIVNQEPRAGSCTVAPGVDVINVQEVDSPVLGVGGLGHGYYSSRPILTDLYQVILGVDVAKRLYIRKADSWEKQDYNLRN